MDKAERCNRQPLFRYGLEIREARARTTIAALGQRISRLQIDA